MSNLSEKLASLSPEQRALFELKLKRLKERQRKKVESKPEAPKIIKRGIVESSPLSLDQERLWFMNQVNRENAAYNIHMTSHLIGELDVGLLDKSINEVIKRHAILRTTFTWVDGQPRQVVTPELSLSWPVVDLQHLSPDEQEEQATLYAIKQTREAFDLEHGPLIRLLLLKMSPIKHVMIVVQHHIITDWWSSQLVIEEIATFYDAFVQTNAPPQLEPPFQYTDFVLWEQERLQQKDMDRSLRYWRKKLAGGTFTLDLPIANPRPTVQTDAGQYQIIHISPELGEQLKAFSSAENATLFMTFTAAINLILFRYSGQTDITLGTPLANRSQVELESILGFLITMLVLHTDLSGEISFRELLKRVRHVILEAYAHQDVPFAKLVEVTQLERDWGRNVLFQHSFIFLTDEGASRGFKSIEMVPIEYDPHVSRFDTTFVVEDHGEQIDCFIEYNTDIFPVESMARFGAHFERLLAALVAHPDMPIAQLPMLTEREQHQLLVEWNDVQLPYPEGQTLHRLFEAQVERHPEAIALVFGDQQLTYQELNQQANQLAHHLQALGAGPLVGICVERSALMVVGMLGILKAGAAYVPLDPAYPSERLGFMLEDAQITTLLTQQKLLVALPHSIQTLCLDADWSIIAQQSRQNVLAPVSSNDLAYVMYTSGSTGKPKGIEIAHRNVLAMLYAYEHVAPRPETLRGTAVCPYGFDVSVWEIFSNLCFGGALHILLPETFASPKLLVDYLIEQEISSAYIPPMLLSDVAAEYEKADWTQKEKNEFPLRRMLVGVEPIKQKVLQRFRNLSADLYIINGYGPTECTICSTFFVFDKASGPEDRTPIGRALANYQVYIVDSEFQPTPIGIPGELCVAGAGVGRGYYQRPELTKEKFVPNPYGEGRVYRTGDLARYLPDGNIEFVGRIDYQVKVRGYRIELGEIQSVLSQHPTVRESVVVAREEAGRKQLVAYVVANEQSGGLSIPDLRSHLSGALPDYMVPAAFVQLASLPLTPNGKIDRKALPAPDALAFTSTSEFALPQTPAEKTLAAIWADLLNMEHIGRHDNFFELGGDSILSLRIINRANQAGLYLTPGQIFEHQTVAGLAAAAGTINPVQAEQGIVTGSLPLTPIQRWFFEHYHRHPHHFNQDILLDVAPTTQSEWVRQAVQELLTHHDALRLRFTRVEQEWQQTNAGITLTPQPLARLPRGEGELEVPYRYVDLSALSAEEQLSRIEAAKEALHASLNLSEGPLLRVALFDLGAEQPAKLLFIIHHLVVDFVSWRILLEDFWTSYRQLERGQTIDLPAKTTSFKEWANWLSDYAQSEALEEELDYWLAIGEAEIAPLPVDYAANKAQDNTLASGAEVVCSLSIEETQLLLSVVPSVYHTQINDLLLTALVQSFAEWTGSNQLLLNLEGHGREELTDELDISRTVGWFTSIFPVLLTLESESGSSNDFSRSGPRTTEVVTTLSRLNSIPDSGQAADAIKSIKEQLRKIPNRGVGYGLLRYLNPETEALLAAQPPAEVSFNYAGQFKELQSESLDGSAHPESPLPHLLGVDGMVVEDQLQLIFSYSQTLYQRSTIEGLAQGFIRALRALIAHCQLPEAGGYTPSDFPLAKLMTQAQVDHLVGNGQTVEDLYPLSPTQSGLLFETLYAPGSGVYVVQFNLRLEGELDSAAFKDAWQQVVSRHPVLRTEFHWSNLPEPLQLVQRHVELPWVEEDWQHLSSEEQETGLQKLMAAQRAQGFDLTQAPLMHWTLIKLSENRYQFIWNFHHLLLDGWSWPLLFSELFTFYQNSPLPGGRPKANKVEGLGVRAPRPYRDYIAWLFEQDMAQAEQFWRETLHGFSAPTPLVVEQPRPEDVPAGSYQSHISELSSPLTQKINTVARQHRLTVNTLVQGAWALLLSRYSRESDVLFGVTVSGRPASLSGVDQMVGLFINTLPLRVQLPSSAKDGAQGDAQSNTLEWLQALQTQMVAQEEYAYAPLVDIQRWSEVLPGTPLFESLVVFENYPLDGTDAPLGDTLRITEFGGAEQANYPLTFIVAPERTPAGPRFVIEVNYERARFEQTTIERLVGHFEQLLSGMVADLSQPLNAIPLLTEAERQQLLITWNETDVPESAEKSAIQLFEEQVAHTPEAVALIFSSPALVAQTASLSAPATKGRRAETQLTYQELNARANQLAHHLQAAGVGPEVMVGLCLERRPELVIGLLAILKAGGAYLPLDPNYPPDRLAFMLADADLQIVVTLDELVERLAQYENRVVCLDLEQEAIAQQPVERPVSRIEPHQLAYVIYTSGSTGQPKGVLLEHRGLGNLARSQIRTFGVTAESRVLQFASLNFDASISEIMMALCSGASLYLASVDELLPGPALTRTLQEQAITHVTLVPSAASTLSPEDFPALQTLILAGEACPSQLARRWLVGQTASLSHRRVFNAYGPTEATVCATMMDCNEPWNEHRPSPPIGRAIDNFQLYILDSQLEPVPIGVPGELHIGGVGVARGYLNRSALTEERFLSTNPSSTSGRLYKTGDLARYLPDGNIEFLGRIDHQVKLRGFRIELGEIEAILEQDAAVQQAVAIVREDGVGAASQQLVGYVVLPEQEGEVKPESKELEMRLRTHLKQTLPDYMIPAAFVVLDRLPLTPNGKVDRKALPAPKAEATANDAAPSQDETAYLPQSRLEREIALIWQEVLGRDASQVGVHDNFFDLGGHSLLVIQVHNRLKEQFDSFPHSSAGGYALTMVDLFKYPTIRGLAKYLAQTEAEAVPDLVQVDERPSPPTPLPIMGEGSIAIISINGRFPGAKDVERFWENLREGVEGITHFSDEELLAAGVDPELLADPNYVKANGILEDIDLFDASFFGFYPREAAMLNPQQRFFLECAWETLEKAGYNPDTYANPIGVYAGCSFNDYIMGLDPAQHADILEDSFQLWLGNDNNFLATQVAYKLNLKGPSLTVQTACSTSLVAVHVACQSLLNRECDMALAGGVTIQLGKEGYLHQPGSIFSPDGHTRTFDAKAAGTVGGSGVGIVLLKRLADAQADGDNILAVIKGSAINNDGAMKVGFTAPSVEGQVSVITRALVKANVRPESISYIEAHGTGTVLGDPIEITALTQTFRTQTDKTGYCKIGSVKSNVGHLDSAAGVAGLIKTVLSLQHKQLPPSLHFEQANSQIDFANSPFEVNTQLTDWAANGYPRRAGVSSFGIGGTNAHVILEEAPERSPASPSRPWQLLLLSARTASALDQATINLAEHLRGNLALTGMPARSTPPPTTAGAPSTLFAFGRPNNRRGETKLADVAYTLQVGRKVFDHRRVLLIPNNETDPESLAETITALETIDPVRLLSGQERIKERPVVFMFPGQGTQYVNMAQELYESEPLFRQTVDTCAELLEAELKLDLRDLLYPAPPQSPPILGGMAQAESASEQLKQTAISQPALFVIEYALARLWMSWGVTPQAMIGHSLGELVAACIAGVFSLEDGLKLVAARGRLMQEMPRGSMLAISRPASEIEPLLPSPSIGTPRGEQSRGGASRGWRGGKAGRHAREGRRALSLATINSPTQCVVSGENAAIEQFTAQLAAQGIEYRRLHTSHAFHSAMMEPVVAPFTEQVKEIALHSPNIPFVSNVTGTWITATEATDPTYWAKHLRQPVRFAEGLQEILSEPEWALLEVGPGRTLSGLVKQQAKQPTNQLTNQQTNKPILTSLPAAAAANAPSQSWGGDRGGALPYLLTTLGRLWLAGVSIDWDGFYHTNHQEKRHRVPLPTYPFERQRYWLEGRRGTEKRSTSSQSQAIEWERAPLEEWFYVPSWKRAVTPPVAHLDEPHSWLLFVDTAGFGQHLLTHLQAAGQMVVTVTAGAGFARLAPDRYTINPQARADYERLLRELEASGKFPSIISHLWHVPTRVVPPNSVDAWLARVEEARALGFDSLLCLAQALGEHTLTQPIKLAVVTSQLVQVTGHERLAPEKATILGPSLVIGQEMSDVTCINIDLPEVAGLSPMQIKWLIEDLVADLTQPRAEVAQEAADSASASGIIAYRGPHRWLQTIEPAQLALAPDTASPLSAMPPLLRQGGTYLITGGLGGIGLTLANYLAENVQANLILTSRSGLNGSERKQKAVRRLQAKGSEVLVLSADVADKEQMAAAIAQATERFGQIHGVIHAAGVPGGGIMQLKTAEVASEVMRPKVQGTLVLDSLLCNTPPDFMVYCSSLASVLGVAGQVDYCAANAFLDLFAHYRSTHPTNPYPVIAINWDSWQEVGMAALTPGPSPNFGRGEQEGRAVNHPLFDECIVEGPNRVVYVSKFKVTEQWVLNEHRIMGQATLPGTAYLELARGAFSEQASFNGDSPSSLEIRDLSFLSPLVVADDEEKEVHTILTQRGIDHQVEFSIVSREGSGEWLEHARGVGSRNGIVSAKRHDLQALAAACQQEMELNDDGAAHTPPPERALITGPRFDTLKRMNMADTQREGLAYLELPAEFAADLESYLLHPTLMDVGTAFLTLPTVSEAVPIGYQKVNISGPLPRKMYSYARYASEPQSDLIKIDVTMMDEQGQERVAIEGFTLMQIGLDTLASRQKPTGLSRGTSKAPSELKNRALEVIIKNNHSAHGIRPHEGASVLEHTLRAARRLPQVIISTLAFSAQIKRARTAQQANAAIIDDQVAAQGYARPALSTSYVAPSSETEQLIAQLWQELLGIEEIGIHDDFFELGGHSLLATRLMADLGSALGQKIPLATLFQAPTIGQLAARLSVRDSQEAQPWAAAIPIQAGGDRAAFFCMPGAGSHVFYLRELAEELGADQPFYGLQPPGLDDDNPPLTRVEDMVHFFLDVLRETQPTGPYLLGGHSAGGHIAFALALALQERGEEVPLLAILDTATIEDINEQAERLGEQHAESLEDYMRLLKERLGDRLSIEFSDLEGLNEDQALHDVAEAYKEANLLPEQASGEQVSRMDAMNQAITEALKDYVPQGVYDGQLLLLQAQKGDFEDKTRMAEGWQALCRKPIDVHTVPGNHLTMFMAPHVEVLGRHLGAAIERAVKAS